MSKAIKLLVVLFGAGTAIASMAIPSLSRMDLPGLQVGEPQPVDVFVEVPASMQVSGISTALDAVNNAGSVTGASIMAPGLRINVPSRTLSRTQSRIEDIRANAPAQKTPRPPRTPAP